MMGRDQGVPAISDPLRGAILYFCSKAWSISRTKLMKLVYLADVHHYSVHRETLTGASYVHWDHGPLSWDVTKARDTLEAKGLVKEIEARTLSGHMAFVPKVVVRDIDSKINLDENRLKTLAFVLQEWGRESTKRIVDYAKETLPFVGTEFGKELDFSRCDPSVARAQAEGISEEEAATRLVIEDEELMREAGRGLAGLENEPLVSLEIDD